LIEYKVEAARMFDDLQGSIRADVVNAIYHLQMRQQAPPPPPPTEGGFEHSDRSGGSEDGNGTGNGSSAQRRPASNGRPAAANGRTPVGARTAAAKVGRNDPCPCGSGKKYKRCHGA
jgi:preprotein translocase subunit SecA